LKVRAISRTGSPFVSRRLIASRCWWAVSLNFGPILGSRHESALYAPFTRTNAEFKEHFKADDIDATLGYRQRLSRAVGRCGRARVLVTQGPNFREAATSAEPLKSSAL
jgi:hypothetical protein